MAKLNMIPNPKSLKRLPEPSSVGLVFGILMAGALLARKRIAQRPRTQNGLNRSNRSPRQKTASIPPPNISNCHRICNITFTSALAKLEMR